MAAPPAQKFATICAVTSWGQAVTPSATTPWSAANTATVTGSGTGGGQRPAIAASWTPTLSSMPSEPGLASWLCSTTAVWAAAMSTGVTVRAARTKLRSFIALPPG